MGKIISDDDMAKLEAAEPPKAKKIISDDDMAKMESSQQATPEDKHDLAPFLKENASGLWDQVKQGVQGVGNAVMHPIDTMNSFSDTVQNVRDHPIDALEGVGRAVRSLPGASDMLTNAKADYGVLKGLATGKPVIQSDLKKEAQAEQDASDQQHAKEHPLTDFIQRSAGLPLTAGAGPGGQAALYAADAFKNSLAEGNDSYTAMKDARNVAALFGTMHAANAGIGKAAEVAKDAGSFLGKRAGNIGLGVPVEAQERYLQDPQKIGAIIDEGPDGLRRLKDKVDQAYNEKITKIRDQAEAGTIDAKQADEAAAVAQKQVWDDHRQAETAYNDHIASLKNVKPDDALTQDVISGVKNENNKLTDLSSKAYQTLDGVDLERQPLLDKIQEIKGRLLVDGKKPTLGDSAPAWGVLERLEKAIQSNQEPDLNSLMNQAQEVPGIAGKDVKRLIQQLDQESSAAYTTYGSRGAAKYIKNVRDDINPALRDVPGYADAMVPTAAQAKLVNGLTRVFGNPEKARMALLRVADPEKGPQILSFIQKLDENNGTNIAPGLQEYMNAQKVLRDPEVRIAAKREALDPHKQNVAAADAARDQTKASIKAAREAEIEARDNASRFNRLSPGSTENTIKSVSRDKNIEAQKQISGLMGDDALQNIKDWSSAQGFIRDTTNGSRKTQLGAHVGKGLGVGVGALIGGPTGAVLGGFIGDTAGAMAGAGLDKYGGTIMRHLLDGSLAATPYAKALTEAAQRGPQALAVAHYTLSQRDPAYRQTIKDLDEKKHSGNGEEMMAGTK